jgi:hypothetical protein
MSVVSMLHVHMHGIGVVHCHQNAIHCIILHQSGLDSAWITGWCTGRGVGALWMCACSVKVLEQLLVMTPYCFNSNQSLGHHLSDRLTD